MADEDRPEQEDASWWAFDAFDDSALPTTTFDEPLVWPEALAWDDPPAPGADDPSDLDPELLLPPPPGILDAVDAAFPPAPPAPDFVWEPPAPDAHLDAPVLDADATAYIEPLASLGGGAGWPPPTAASESASPAEWAPPLPDSIWTASDAPQPPPGFEGLLITSTMAPGAVYEADGGGRSDPGRRRFGVLRGNAAVIAMISLASLVLLGMFLSVRARDDVPTTTASQSPPTTTDAISVTGSLNTIPLVTAETSPGSAPGINIGELLAPTESTATPTTVRSAPAASPTTTAAARPTTVTTTAPAPQATTSPATTSPPIDTTQPVTTRRPIPTSSIVIPTAPTIPPQTTSSIVIPRL